MFTNAKSQTRKRGCDSDGAEHLGDASAQGADRARRGCDTSYRASSLDTHPTHVCIQFFRHFLGGLCARAMLLSTETPANLPRFGRVNGALWEVLS